VDCEWIDVGADEPEGDFCDAEFNPKCDDEDEAEVQAIPVVEAPSDFIAEGNVPDGFVIVGDNIDKNVRPSFQRVDRKTESWHCFH